jgi:LPS sulfotransferase NodH
MMGGLHYQELDRVGGFDYDLHQISGLGEGHYRGPRVDLDRPFLAFVGAAQTFGRFAHDPFPTLVGQRLGLPVLNLGVGGAGPRHFNTPRYMKVLNRAEAVVLQVLSGRSSSNSLFDNAASGSLRGRTCFGDGPMRAEEFFTQAAKYHSRDVLERLVRETRDDYVKQFLALLEKITAPRVLFWFSTRTPEYEEDYTQPPYGIIGEFPHLVNRRMSAELAAACDAYVECVSSAGLPQPLWPADYSIDGAACGNGRLENRYYPSPDMHVAAANALETVCKRFSGRPSPPREEAFRRFVIVGAERTGTNLLISLLNQHLGCLCMNELFNPVSVAAGVFPGDDVPESERVRLAMRRQTDPIGFWRELSALSRSRGYRTFGFKLFYSHALTQPDLLSALAADKTVTVIHVTRRNLLRRLVSERQALAVRQWVVGWAARLEPRPAVPITPGDLWQSVHAIQTREAMFEALFEDHPVLRLVYEDLAERPQQVGARAAVFLGAPARPEPAAILYQRTGADDLSHAIEGFDELRARVRRWSAFFEG